MNIYLSIYLDLLAVIINCAGNLTIGLIILSCVKAIIEAWNSMTLVSGNRSL